MIHKSSIHSNTPLENSKITFESFYQTDLKNTLENVVFKQEPKIENGTLEKILSDKTKILKATVKALLEEIARRENVHSLLLEKIDDEIAEQNTLILGLENQPHHYSFDKFIEITKTRLDIRETVLDLEKEKRREHVESWRDLMFMKKYLMSALREYWDLVKRRETLSGDLTELDKNENVKRN